MHDHDRISQRPERDDRTGAGRPPLAVRIVGSAALPTRYGNFRIVGFSNNWDSKEHLAIVRGEVAGKAGVVARVHSECLTGDALGSLRCDCRDQLESALLRISKEPAGVVLYLRQEGRGIGLLNKIRAYGLQDQGLDTVDANLALGFRDDERDYAVAALMLRALAIESVALLTNNPEKLRQLQKEGVRVERRLPHVSPSNPHNQNYLATKARRSGHLFQNDLEVAE